MNGDDDLVGRVLVLEDGYKRHDKDIDRLKDQTSDHALRLTELSQIQTTLKEIRDDVKILKDCQKMEEGAAKMKTGWWANYGDLVKAIIIFLMGVAGTWFAYVFLHVGAGK